MFKECKIRRKFKKEGQQIKPTMIKMLVKMKYQFKNCFPCLIVCVGGYDISKGVCGMCLFPLIFEIQRQPSGILWHFVKKCYAGHKIEQS